MGSAAVARGGIAMWHMPNPTVLATPAFIVLVIAEMLFVRFTGRGKFEARDTAASLFMGFGSVVLGGLLGFVFVAFANLVQPYRLFDIGWSWTAIAVCFVVDDVRYYWWHRASHRVRWLWADHVNHHSSQHYNLATALRQPWFGALALPGMLFIVPLILIGFRLPMIAFAHGINLVYQFWVHTEAIDKFPRWFEAVMNTPSHHRVHHATNPRYLDSNYAGVFIVWDKMFGTFVAEREDDKPRYGIVKNIASFNPIMVAIHEWVGMVRDLASARSLREIGGYLFAPPGWSPDGSRDTSDSIRAQWAQFRNAASAEQPAE
jgi:sterol desaturase/sphingolipid hydroxylase (fatty acid hydroxylase superfamily)